MLYEVITDDSLEAIKDELIYAKKLAADEEGRVLVWTEAAEAISALGLSSLAASQLTEPEREPLSYTPPHLAEKILTTKASLAGERKQVTVLFADIKDSTELIRDRNNFV